MFFQSIFSTGQCFFDTAKVVRQHLPFIIIQVDTTSSFHISCEIKTVDPCVPLLVFSPYAGYKEHLSTQMNFVIGNFQLCLVNASEVFLCLMPNIDSVENSFPPVEELFFNHQNLLSEKKQY